MRPRCFAGLETPPASSRAKLALTNTGRTVAFSTSAVQPDREHTAGLGQWNSSKGDTTMNVRAQCLPYIPASQFHLHSRASALTCKYPDSVTCLIEACLPLCHHICDSSALVFVTLKELLLWSRLVRMAKLLYLVCLSSLLLRGVLALSTIDVVVTKTEPCCECGECDDMPTPPPVVTKTEPCCECGECEDMPLTSTVYACKATSQTSLLPYTSGSSTFWISSCVPSTMWYPLSPATVFYTQNTTLVTTVYQNGTAPPAQTVTSDLPGMTITGTTTILTTGKSRNDRRMD